MWNSTGVLLNLANSLQIKQMLDGWVRMHKNIKKKFRWIFHCEMRISQDDYDFGKCYYKEVPDYGGISKKSLEAKSHLK